MRDFINALWRKIHDLFWDSSCTDLKKIDHGKLEIVGHEDLEKINILFY